MNNGDTNSRVLVLNQNYEPLNVCRWQRAVTLVFLDKAIVVESDSKTLHSPTITMPMPSVVRLVRYIKRPLPKIKLSRQSLMERDSYTCQYCGKQSKHLTVDHIVPRERGGRHTWSNLVACCVDCNVRKGNRTARQAEMKLLKDPQRPRFIPYLSFATMRRALTNEVWRDYLEPFAPHLAPD